MVKRLCMIHLVVAHRAGENNPLMEPVVMFKRDQLLALGAHGRSPAGRSPAGCSPAGRSEHQVVASY